MLLSINAIALPSAVMPVTSVAGFLLAPITSRQELVPEQSKALNVCVDVNPVSWVVELGMVMAIP